MPRNQITKDEFKCWILKLKYKVHTEEFGKEKNTADKYLNILLDKIEEYRY